MKNTFSNYFYNGEVIVSYDCSKIWEEKVHNRIVFCKKTIKNEVKNLIKMNKLLENKNVNINNHKYKLKVPKIYNWDNKEGILSMEFCKGKNLEFYLRNEDTYTEGQLLLNKLLDFFIENKIYWLDFAARNIIIGEKEIFFVDYEKGFARKNIKIKNFFRNHIYEEYCIFLFLKDRKYNADEIFNLKNEKNYTLNLNKIKCKRCYKMAQLLGYNDTITKKQYLDILKIIITAQEPTIINNHFHFPCIELDKIFTNQNKESSLEIYCQKVMNLYQNKK